MYHFFSGEAIKGFRIVIKLYPVSLYQFLRGFYGVGLVIGDHDFPVLLKKDVDNSLNQHLLAVGELFSQPACLKPQHKGLLPEKPAFFVRPAHAPGKAALEKGEQSCRGNASPPSFLNKLRFRKFIQLTCNFFFHPLPGVRLLSRYARLSLYHRLKIHQLHHLMISASSVGAGHFLILFYKRRNIGHYLRLLEKHFCKSRFHPAGRS